MLPARPVPVLSAVTIPPLEIWTVSAEFNTISPPLPAPSVLVVIALPAPEVGECPETEIVSAAVIFTVPALPGPMEKPPLISSIPLRLRIEAPSFKKSEFTFATMAPAFPSQPVDASILVSAFMVSTGVFIVIVPASPGVRSVTLVSAAV